MRILQVGKFYPPYHGGMETVLKNLSEGLVEAGHDVTVTCFSDSKTSSVEIVNGVRVHRNGTAGKLFSQPLSWPYGTRLRELAKKHDLIHLHSPNPLAESLSLTLPPSLPRVVTYHSDIVRQKLLLPIYAPILRSVLSRASRIVVGDEANLTRSPVLRRLQEKCSVVPFGIDEREFELTPRVATQVAELQNRYGRFFLFVGRLVGYKGLPVLLEALARTDGRVVIIGDGPERSALEARALSLGLKERAHFLGQVSDDRMNAYYHACYAFVLPSISRNEAFGMVQVEAMACGRPVICSRLDSGAGAVIEDGKSGMLFEPSNPQELASALKMALQDPDSVKRMGQAARERFEERFTRSKMVAAYLRIYSEL